MTGAREDLMPEIRDLRKRHRDSMPTLLSHLLVDHERPLAAARISLDEWPDAEGYALVTDRRLIIVQEREFIKGGNIHGIEALSDVTAVTLDRVGDWDGRPELCVTTADSEVILQFHTRDLDYVRAFAAHLTTPSAAIAPRTWVRIVDAGGEDLEIGVWPGSDSGPVVVTSNGLGGCLEDWLPVTSLLPDLMTITFNRPGFGDSPPSRRSSRALSVECDRMIAVADAIAPGRPLVVAGWSYGGLIAEATALLHPSRVVGLVLVDAHPTNRGAQVDDCLEKVRNPLERWTGGGVRANENNRIKRHAKEARRVKRDTTLDSIPVRVLVAAERPRMKRFAANPHAELVSIECNHEMLEEAPRAVAEAIRAVVGLADEDPSHGDRL